MLDPGLIVGEGDELVPVEVERVWCDAAAFAALVKEGREEEALELYRGPLLEGFHLSGVPAFERWVEEERHRFHPAAVEAAWRLVERAADDPSEARRWADRALELAPYDEEGLRRYLVLMAEHGQAAAAVRTCETYVERLAAELELEPSAETVAPAERIRAGDRVAGRTASPRVGPPALSVRAATASPTEVSEAPRRESGTVRSVRTAGTGGRGRRTLRIGTAALAAAASLAVGWWGVSQLRGGTSAIRSVVVLPLDNLTGDPAQEYFVDGMHEALSGELSKIGALKVISRTSAMFHKGMRKPPAPQIARDLGVDGLIEGAVGREADRVKITVQLIHARSDRHLWAETYERELRGVLGLQRDVAMEIARQMKVALTPAEKTPLAAVRAVHPRAYELYLRGRHFTRQGNFATWDQALAAFERSVAIDSGFAPAWAGLAMMYALRTLRPRPDSVEVARARPAIAKAPALDPNLSAAYVWLALIRQFLDWDWKGAEDPFRRALELDPSNWEAHYEYGLLERLGRHDEALAQMQRGLAVDPLSTTLQMGLSKVLTSARRPDEAIEAARKALQLHPSSPQIQASYAEALESAGRTDQAHEADKRYFALCCEMSAASTHGSRRC